jgi:hypothetical protein
MRQLYKKTKVIYDAHQEQYEVYYKNFLFWHYDSCYKFDSNPKFKMHYIKKDEAERIAIIRAKAMLATVEVWSGTNILEYYY